MHKLESYAKIYAEKLTSEAATALDFMYDVPNGLNK
jgi:hypothetical protein